MFNCGFRKPIRFSSDALEGMLNIQHLMKLHNPKLEKVKAIELIDDRILRKLDESGFIERVYSSYELK